MLHVAPRPSARRRDARRVRVALAALLVAVGCGESSETAPPVEPVRAAERVSVPEAAELLEKARDEIEVERFEEAYPHLKAIHENHPNSLEDVTAFTLASRIVGRAYRRDRYADPESRWMTTERLYVYDWLATFVWSEFPRERVEDMLVRTPWSYAQLFVAWAEGQPRMAQWEMRVEEDNGLVERVTAVRREGTAAP